MQPLEKKSIETQLAKNHIRILVADDELGMRQMLSTALEFEGYQVVTAVNGAEALDKIRQNKFNLVITDLKMPKMDGIQLLEEIKKINPGLEVIMATGHGTIEDAVAAMKNGAYDFILKPYNLDELNGLVSRALEKNELKTMVALYEASHDVFSTMELGKLLEKIMDMSREVLGADEGSIMLLDENKKLRIAASRGLADDVAKTVQLEIGERIAGSVAKEKKGRLLLNGLENYEEFKQLNKKAGIHSSIVCPLLSQGELVGVLNLNKTRAGENFTLMDFHSASIFASQAALAIQNAKLYSTLQEAYEKLESTQVELLQSEKLASIGRLVAGVAHELNNPLTSVVGYSQLLQDTEDLKEARRQLSIINSEGLRCSRIVRDLLLFARRQKPNYQSIDPALLVEEALKGLSIELENKKIEVEKDFPKQPVVLHGDPHLLQQVFTNILTNSCHAMEKKPAGGKIRVKINASGEKLEVLFWDNGSGIPKEHIQRIFDPFYTTKEVGKGTGLGLSLSYGIVKDHGGKILVESKPGEETLFTVELPLKVNGDLSSPDLERPRETRFKFPAGTKILMTEDEEPIQKLVEAIFHGQDCRLDMAPDGQQALEMIKKENYDVVLCDYRMPRLDGVQLFEEVRKIKPDMASRFLFITGSTEFMKNFDTFFKENDLDCLLKPFTRNEFIAAVNATALRLEKLNKQRSGHENK